MPLDTTTIPDRHDRSGSKIRKFFRITGPSSYAAGGEALSLGLSNVEVVLCEQAYNGTDLRSVRYNASTGKMQWFTAAGVEIAPGVDLSAYATRVEAIGH